ncbi:DUF5036 family protein [Bacteroidales bacterium OttesenSCG-928-J19]|nr:DUF5036 family protein [Bacteroidales bacterium OttesenSCG-928-J19]
MKIYKLFLSCAISILALSFVSCDNDDDNNSADPAGTVTLNMLDEENGKIMLGNSDVYIDKAYNFSGYSCLVTSLGSKNGLGSLSSPILKGFGSKSAVEPGCAYQIFNEASLRKFPSGNYALNIQSDYYNVFVTSQILDEETIVGAQVKYILMNVPSQDLPSFDSFIGTIYSTDYNTYELEVTLPSSDFECEPNFASSNYYTIEYEKKDNKLIVRLVKFNRSDVFGFYIRIKDSYTYIYGKVQ